MITEKERKVILEIAESLKNVRPLGVDPEFFEELKKAMNPVWKHAEEFREISKRIQWLS